MTAKKSSASRYRTQFDKNYVPNEGTVNNEESKTRPDMTLSVRSLLHNHTRGMGLGVKTREGIYSETEIPIFEDITDMHEYAAHLKSEQEKLEKEIKEQAEKQRKEKEALDKLKKAKEAGESIKTTKPPQKEPEQA